jgi:phosphoglycerate dehydrogenase-like enzyme
MVDQLDLHSGRSPWLPSAVHAVPGDRLRGSMRCRILIVGSGITGSFLAERLSRITTSIAVVDRHVPHTASTSGEYFSPPVGARYASL